MSANGSILLAPVNLGFSKSHIFSQRFQVWDQVVNSTVTACTVEEEERDTFPSIDRAKNLIVNALPRNKEGISSMNLEKWPAIITLPIRGTSVSSMASNATSE